MNERRALPEDPIDVAIVGGGPAGLTLAKALADSGLKLAVFEQSPESALAEPGPDGKEIALTHASKALLDKLGIWSGLPESAISMLKDAAVFDGESDQPMRITHEDGGRECLGWLVSNQSIKQSAYDAIADQPELSLITEVSVDRTSLIDRGRRVHLSDGRHVDAQLVVAADSRFSNLRRVTGIGARMRDFGQSMLLARVQLERDHEHVAWEWFGYDRALALLPLNDQMASAVITLPHERIERLAGLDETAFNREVSGLYRHRLGPMSVVGERHIYPLVGVWPDRLVDEHLAVLGDAAVGMHPVTAHGFNLGLKGVELLSKQLIDAPPGQLADRDRLATYQRQLRLASLPLYVATQTVVGLYSQNQWPLKVLRRSMLRLAGRLGPFRRAVARQLTG
mgnify:FL=1